MSASKSGHKNVAETLLQHGASVDMQKDVSTGDISSLCLHEVVHYCTMLCHVEASSLKYVNAF